MEASTGNSDAYRDSSLSSSSSSSSGNFRRNIGMHFSASNFFHSPLSTLLEFSGVLRAGSSTHPLESSDSFINKSAANDGEEEEEEEVSIRIIGSAEQEDQDPLWDAATAQNEVYVQPPPMGRNRIPLATSSSPSDSSGNLGSGENVSESLNGGVDADAVDGAGANGRDSSYQRYDIQQAARWVEQVLPFFLILLVVFIRQHFQGFFATVWIAAVMFKSNEILRNQTALKGEGEMFILISISSAFMLYVIGVYWWY